MNTTTFQMQAGTIPLRYPYIDEPALKSIPSADARFAAALCGLSNADADTYHLEHDRMPDILRAQYLAGKHICRRLNEIGISQIDAAEKTGIDKTALCKFVQGQRPFSPSGELLPPLCYGILSESCHKVLFGHEGVIHLPATYSAGIRAFLQLGKAERVALIHLAENELALYHKQFPSAVRFGSRRNFSELVGERIQELVCDLGVPGYQLLGPDTPYPIRAYLRKFYREDYRKEHPRIGHLMYISFDMEQAIDYFIAEDFTLYTPCFYLDGEKWVEIKDRDALHFIGICAAVPSEQRAKLLGEAVGRALGKV